MVKLTKGKYKDCASVSEMRSRLSSQGYSIFEWQDRPGAYYSPHSHPHTEVIVIASGAITFTIDGHDYAMEEADELVLPANTTHTAVNNGTADVKYFICT